MAAFAGSTRKRFNLSMTVPSEETERTVVCGVVDVFRSCGNRLVAVATSLYRCRCFAPVEDARTIQVHAEERAVQSHRLAYQVWRA